MKNYALTVHQLSVNYDKTPALWDISLEIPQGKLVAIVGPNGAGKSTFLKTAIGLIKPLSGNILFLGAKISSMRKEIAYVPQRESVDWDFPITVFELVLMGCFGRRGIFRRVGKEDKEKAHELLAKVGLFECADRQISQLSGGQQQRAFLARALMQNAHIYFMDEPFSGIDVASASIIIDILKKLKEEGKTLFIVHHDLESIRTIFDWVILLNMRLVGYGSVEDTFTPDMIQKTYGVQNSLFGEANRLSKEKLSGL